MQGLSACRRRLLRLSLPERIDYNFPFVQMDHTALQHLIGLMPFARQQYDIPRLCVGDGPVNGLHPILHHHMRGAVLRNALQDIRNDRARLFGARVIRSNHQKIGQFSRNRAHLRSFASITVAAAAEHGYEPSLLAFPQRTADIF